MKMFKLMLAFASLSLGALSADLVSDSSSSSSSVDKCDQCNVKNINTGVTYNHLQEAIDEANPGETLKLEGTCSGNFTIDKDLVIRGGDCAVIDGLATGSVITINVPEPIAQINGCITVVLKNLTIRNGSAENGGGIVNNQAILTLDHVVVTDNRATSFGGGLYSVGGTNYINRSRFSHNVAQFGGGIYQSDCSTAVLSATDISKNSASENGGGLYQIDSTMSINESKIHLNNALRDGGGLYNYSNTANINHSVFQKNTAGNTGGGIFNGINGSLNLTDPIFDDNKPNDLTDE